MRRGCAGLLLASLWSITLLAAIAVRGQLGERPFSGSLDHPAIGYAVQQTTDAVAALNKSLADKPAQLRFDPQSGYLGSILEALHIPIESQLLLFSKTGVQRVRTSPANPRALFFNDAVVVGYIRGAPFLEVAVLDPRQGAIFYTLNQEDGPSRQLTRAGSCLTCHESYSTLAVPGFLTRSQATGSDGQTARRLGEFIVDHRTPFEQRWGGWYVTAARGLRHMGNHPIALPETPETTLVERDPGLESVSGRVDTRGYPTPYSDVVALMVFEHQARMMNLLTRLGWEVRVAVFDNRADFSSAPLRDAVDEFVDYLLFVDEAVLPSPLSGTSGFATSFTAHGLRDQKGRSLRAFDLRTRLFRYPCSYMIYSDAFDQLPPVARDAIYRRLWQILSGDERGSRYARLPAGTRRAIIDILRDTRPGLPAYFR